MVIPLFIQLITDTQTSTHAVQRLLARNMLLRSVCLSVNFNCNIRKFLTRYRALEGDLTRLRIAISETEVMEWSANGKIESMDCWLVAGSNHLIPGARRRIFPFPFSYKVQTSHYKYKNKNTYR